MNRFSPLLLLLSLSTIAGCGGDDPGAGPSTATPVPTQVASATTLSSRTPSQTPTAVSSATRAVSPTPTPSATASATFEASPVPTTAACCGNGVVETAAGEECDDGNGIGGDGCAANCTIERSGTVSLRGHGGIQTGLFFLSLDLSSQQTLRLGAPTGASAPHACDGAADFEMGEIPVAQRAEDVRFEPAQIPGLVCACTRPFAIKRCAPPLIHVHGTDCSLAADCSADADVCESPSDCGFAHGEGNASSGVIGCAGLDDVDYQETTDARDRSSMCSRSGGRAAAGSALIFASTRIGTISDSGTCSIDTSNPAKGPDGVPCTDDDPPASLGTPDTTLLTSGTAGASIIEPLAVGHDIAAGVDCGSAPCQTSGTGRPFSCDDLQRDPPSPGDVRLCSAFTALSQPMAGDTVVTNCFEVEP